MPRGLSRVPLSTRSARRSPGSETAARMTRWPSQAPEPPVRKVPTPPPAQSETCCACATGQGSRSLAPSSAAASADRKTRRRRTGPRVHRAHHAPNPVQMSTLLSIKTGACPEDCAYCPQSVRFDTGLTPQALMDVAAVRECATRARAAGATRFCMGAAYRAPKAKDLQVIAQMIREVRALGLESCATLGMLTPAQALELKAAGRDYYNHNLDTSPEFYGEIISTRTYQDRLDTLSAVRAAGLKVCSGGIIRMGESGPRRARLLRTLANLPEHPQSVPINRLVRVPGTPPAPAPDAAPFHFV